MIIKLRCVSQTHRCCCYRPPVWSPSGDGSGFCSWPSGWSAGWRTAPRSRRWTRCWPAAGLRGTSCSCTWTNRTARRWDTEFWHAYRPTCDKTSVWVCSGVCSSKSARRSLTLFSVNQTWATLSHLGEKETCGDYRRRDKAFSVQNEHLTLTGCQIKVSATEWELFHPFHSFLSKGKFTCTNHTHPDTRISCYMIWRVTYSTKSLGKNSNLLTRYRGMYVGF